MIEVFDMTCQDDVMLTYHGNLFVNIRVQVMHAYIYESLYGGLLVRTSLFVVSS